MSNVIKLALSMIVGIIIGYKVAPQPKPQLDEMASRETPASSDAKRFAGKFQYIYDEEISGYLEMKASKEKYLKANEIIAKVMTVFKDDLAIRMSLGDVKRLERTTIEENLESSDLCRSLAPIEEEGNPI